MTYLKVKNITKSFGKSKVLKNVDLAIEKNEVVALLGESGSGKTTLLRIIAGLENADQGEILLDERILENRQLFLKAEQRKVGVIFQDYALFPHLSVRQNVSYGLKKNETSKVDQILKSFELLEHAKKKPHQLSGGQQQRVAIARSIVVNPSLLLLDEPFSSLDQSLKRKVRSEISNLLRQQNIPSILVTHDPDDAMEMADKIAILQQGEIVQYDTPEKIYHAPVNEYVGNLTGGINVINGELKRPVHTSFIKDESSLIEVIKSNFYHGQFFISAVSKRDNAIYHSVSTENLESGTKVSVK